MLNHSFGGGFFLLYLQKTIKNMSKITVEKAKEQGLKIIDTQRKRHGATNPKAVVKVVAIVTDTNLVKGREYECHPSVAEILIKLKKVEKVIKKED